MKRYPWLFGIMIVTGMTTAIAQPGPPGGLGKGGPGGGLRGGPGPSGALPPMPVIEALDVDRNHVISADELKNATLALLTLDKNRDGQLTENEFGSSGPNGPSRKLVAARPASQQGNNGRSNQRKSNPTPEGSGRNEAGPPPPNSSRLVEHAMEFDLDKDGKLSREELKKFAEDFASLHQGEPGELGGAERDKPNGPGAGSSANRARRPD